MSEAWRVFEAPIQDAGGGGYFVEVPFDVEEAFGGKRVRIQATFDGQPDPPYRGSLVRMGGPAHILIVRKAIRERIRKGAGDTVEVAVRKDTEPRSVIVPDDLAAALSADSEAAAAFDALSYTHRKEYVQWVGEAKRERTRVRRIEGTVAMVKEGKTR